MKCFLAPLQLVVACKCKDRNIFLNVLGLGFYIYSHAGKWIYNCISTFPTLLCEERRFLRLIFSLPATISSPQRCTHLGMTFSLPLYKDVQDWADPTLRIGSLQDILDPLRMDGIGQIWFRSSVVPLFPLQLPLNNIFQIILMNKTPKTF